jgi:hypothetical protein
MTKFSANYWAGDKTGLAVYRAELESQNSLITTGQKRYGVH